VATTVHTCEDLPFGPLAEENPLEIAVLWGKPETGPAAVMVRLPEGYQEPWHSHTTTYHFVLVKGTFRTRGKNDNVEPKLFGPGSYAVQLGGLVHSEINAGEGELVAFVNFDGSVDFILDN
jgi:quercetin dioxygenase-like cupin family protein